MIELGCAMLSAYFLHKAIEKTYEAYNQMRSQITA